MIRIVKMIFKKDKTEEFKAIFEESQPYIEQMSGCNGVRLLQDIRSKQTLFTESIWDCEDDLNNYRNSTFFKTTWQKTKVLFDAKPEAWSLHINTPYDRKHE